MIMSYANYYYSNGELTFEDNYLICLVESTPILLFGIPTKW